MTKKKQNDEVDKAVNDFDNVHIEHESQSGKPLIPTGVTPLSLAVSDSISGGPPVGKIFNIVGDSSSGKTLLALTIMASAFYSGRFNFRYILDDAESALEFNIPHLFGEDFANVLEHPHFTNPDDIVLPSRTSEQFCDNIRIGVDSDRPIFMVLDSMDSLTSEGELDLLDEQAKARSKGKDIPQSYGTERAKTNARNFRTSVEDIESSNSIICVISQTREELDPRKFVKKYRAGGSALDFWSSVIIWLMKKGHIQRRKREVGTETKAKLDKNRITGKRRQVEWQIFNDYGIDDVRSCIKLLVDIGYFNKSGKGGVINVNDKLGMEIEPCQESKLVQTIEENDLELNLAKLTQQAWNEEEEKIKDSWRVNKFDKMRKLANM